ncbi:hypothetical protein AcV7_000042 [Taiwanofungus camphoratus]|nr:hypothetical protein AcV7_000042 [Antrodia cinnamomea]
MLPEWNIKGVIIEPGGFRTQWNGSSLICLPIHPKYNTPSSPSNSFRETVAQPYVGDPAKAAKAIMQISSLSNPPLRIQLGTEALMIARNKALETIRDGEKYEDLAHSTNADGIDKNMVLEWFKVADN